MTDLLVKLWAHQQAAINAVELAMAAGRNSGLIVLPTGAGKTGMVLSLGRRLGMPMLFLVNRDTLLGQTVDSARRFWPEALVATIEAGRRPWDVEDLYLRRKPDLVVGMVNTVLNRLPQIDPERFGIVVPDEAHYSPAPTWRKVIGHFKPGFLLGLTATPQRLDGKGLAEIYGREPLYTCSLHQAIKDGVLSPFRSERIETCVSLDGVGSKTDDDGDEDLDERQLSKEINVPARNATIVEAYRKHAMGRRAVAFAVDVDHAEDLAFAFRDCGLRAEAVVGTRPRRWQRDTLEAFAAGEFDVLTTCELLTTGFDDPGISCVIWSRPTKSRALYIQGTGRGLRLAPGKKDCLILDITDNSKLHKLVSALDLTGRASEKKGESVQVRPPKPEQPELPMSRGLPAIGVPVAWKLETVCPWPEMPSLEGYLPVQEWHNEPASDGQLRFLSGFGLAPAEPLSKGEASYLIDRAQEFEAAFPLPATPKQRHLLEQHGLWTEGTGKRQASILISSLKQAEKRQQTEAQAS